MNLSFQIAFTKMAGRLVAGLALLAFVAVGHAELTGGGRWLLIFDTASAMKSRLPATEAALKQFLSTSANGEMEAGDSVGVWAFDKQLDARFPTFSWVPEKATLADSNLVAFLHAHRYKADSHLALLQTPIKQVVDTSRRLTIILFCDGQSDISGTPYDQGINQTIHDTQAERKKSRQPFVVVLRTQFGKFTGCTLNFPPADLSLPPFPPPPPVAKIQPVTNTPPPRPTVVEPHSTAPPLIIVGTQVSTNPGALTTISEPATNASVSLPTNSVIAVTNPVVARAQPVIIATNPVVAPTNPPATNQVAAATQTAPPPVVPPPLTSEPVAPQPEKIVVAPAVTGTNPVAATAPETENSDHSTTALIYFGIALLVAAGALVVFLLLRAGRRPHSSLITSSMQNDPHRK